jgi:hypothetical protein
VLRAMFAAVGIWLVLVMGPCGSASRVQGPQQQETVTAEKPLTLTTEHPTGAFSLAPATVIAAPPVLELSVEKIANPAMIPFGIFAYLVPETAEAPSDDEKILIGNVSIYPPDRPGKFSMRASTAFEKLRAKGKSQARLLIEMKALRDTKPGESLEVTVAPPTWRKEE